MRDVVPVGLGRASRRARSAILVASIISSACWHWVPVEPRAVRAPSWVRVQAASGVTNLLDPRVVGDSAIAGLDRDARTEVQIPIDDIVSLQRRAIRGPETVTLVFVVVGGSLFGLIMALPET